MFSFWEKDYFSKKKDIIVVGAGFTGLSAAYHLKQRFPDQSICVLERGNVPMGASSKNAGFACFGSLSEIVDDLKSNSEDQVFELLKTRFHGLQKIKSFIADESIDLEYKGSYELFRQKEMHLFQECSEELPRINNILAEIIGPKVFQIVDLQTLNFKFNGIERAIFNPYEGQLNPLNLVKVLERRCLAIGVDIQYTSEVSSIEEIGNGYLLHLTNGIEKKCERLLLCTNGFSGKFIQEDIQAARAQVLITKEIDDLNINCCFHMDRGYYYFRNVGKRLLLGGARNMDINGENSEELITTKNIQNELERVLKEEILPNTAFTIDHRWSGIMGVGKSKKPIVKKVNDQLYCAVRLGGMGVAIGFSTGEQLAALVD